MGSIGFPEMVFIFVLALLIFGPKKLPELGRSLGKGLSEFRRASSELRNSFDREMDTIEREARLEEERKAAASSTSTATNTDTAAGTAEGATTTASTTGSNPDSDPYASDYSGYDYDYSGDRSTGTGTGDRKS